MPRHSDTKARLIHTAADLIWRTSYHATGVDRICEGSAVKKGSFYHHFVSKEDLAIAALEAMWHEAKPKMDAIFSPAVPPLERLCRMARWDLEFQEKRLQEAGCVCGCPLFSLGSEIGTRESKLRAKVEELLDTQLRYLESAIRDAHAAGEIDAPAPARKARILQDYIEGTHTRARIFNTLQPICEIESGILEILGVQVAVA
ncbi:MAG: TetR/AcrR family transcriptional regulator [Verrucomicrobiales bacterium]|nr:TetR/AcrR family transcriptional regulator [Verrucomicrobiales bacterium]